MHRNDYCPSKNGPYVSGAFEWPLYKTFQMKENCIKMHCYENLEQLPRRKRLAASNWTAGCSGTYGFKLEVPPSKPPFADGEHICMDVCMVYIICEILLGEMKIFRIQCNDQQRQPDVPVSFSHLIHKPLVSRCQVACLPDAASILLRLVVLCLLYHLLYSVIIYAYVN